MQSPKKDETYQCAECDLEIRVTKSCECDECSTKLECCGKPLKKVA